MTGFGVEQAHQALRAAGACCSTSRYSAHFAAAHCGITMERQQDGIIMDAATPPQPGTDAEPVRREATTRQRRSSIARSR
ncbi:hypothetical protein M8494_22890 [Serratia ureilytica]